VTDDVLERREEAELTGGGMAGVGFTGDGRVFGPECLNDIVCLGSLDSAMSVKSVVCVSVCAGGNLKISDDVA
jgi:hypothetical protein